MSKYRKDSYYFIKLYDSFLNGDEIKWIEKQEDGARIILTFLRLMIIAKNRNGKLEMEMGEIREAYTNEELAKETFQTAEFIEKVLDTCERVGLVENKGDHYFIEKSLEFTNQITAGALKKQDYRLRLKKKADKMADNCLPDIEEEKETEKEERNKNKEKEEDTYIEKIEGFPYDEIIEHLNKTIGSNYKSNSKAIIKLINQHVEEGFDKEDFINVINKKYKEWNGTELSKFLRPTTLFGNKFESYVNQKEEEFTYVDFD